MSYLSGDVDDDKRNQLAGIIAEAKKRDMPMRKCSGPEKSLKRV